MPELKQFVKQATDMLLQNYQKGKGSVEAF